MVGGEHYLKISAPRLEDYELTDELINESICDKGDCRTAPATRGLLISLSLI